LTDARSSGASMPGARAAGKARQRVAGMGVVPPHRPHGGFIAAQASL